MHALFVYLCHVFFFFLGIVMTQTRHMLPMRKWFTRIQHVALNTTGYRSDASTFQKGKLGVTPELLNSRCSWKAKTMDSSACYAALNALEATTSLGSEASRNEGRQLVRKFAKRFNFFG